MKKGKLEGQTLTVYADREAIVSDKATDHSNRSDFDLVVEPTSPNSSDSSDSEVGLDECALLVNSRDKPDVSPEAKVVEWLKETAGQIKKGSSLST